MKTIAISIEQEMVARLDRLLVRKEAGYRSRSELVRKAVGEFVQRLERELEEERERLIFRRHRKRLDREAAALIAEQAGP